jgi:high-affinity Fe2+/Pb2+ permease
MWIGTLLAVLCGWFLLCATRRAEGRLRGWPGTMLGLAAALLAAWQLHASGMGLAVSIAQVLAVAMLALPGLSYWQAARRRTAKEIDRGVSR